MKRIVLSIVAGFVLSPLHAQTLEALAGVSEPLIHINAWGNIRVTGSSGRRVSATLRPTSHGPAGEAPRRAPFGLGMKDARGFIWADVAGDLDVIVPARSRLVIHSYRWGGVEVAGICGDLEVTAHEGGVVLRGAGGAVVAHAANGAIRAEFAWRAPRPSTLTSMHGAIDITIPSGVRVLPRLRTEEGVVESAVPWQHGLRAPDSRREGVQLLAYTRFGPIRLREADPQKRCEQETRE